MVNCLAVFWGVTVMHHNWSHSSQGIYISSVAASSWSGTLAKHGEARGSVAKLTAGKRLARSDPSWSLWLSLRLIWKPILPFCYPQKTLAVLESDLPVTVVFGRSNSRELPRFLAQVFTAVTYWRLAPDPILANQLLNCVEASETPVLRQMQLLKIQVFRGIFRWRSWKNGVGGWTRHGHCYRKSIWKMCSSNYWNSF